MIEYLKPAIASLTAAKNIVSSLLELRDSEKITAATMDLKDHLIQTYDYIISEKERMLSLQERISELERECERLKDWSAEKEQYERKAIAQGVFAYMSKDFHGLPQNGYKLCCSCFDKNVKSPLQQNTRMKKMSLLCPNGCPEIMFEYYILVK